MVWYFNIPPETQGLVYGICYLLAFLIAGTVLFISGSRRKYPTVSWLIIILFMLFCVILGDKLITTYPEEWWAFFQDLEMPDSGRKSVLGGIIGLVTGILTLKYIFRLKVNLADHFAMLVPITIGISRFGCLMVGCCHGLPTKLPWGIQYGLGTPAFELHLSKGLVGNEMLLSKPVHPTQIYDILFCILTVLLLWLFRKYWKRNGSKLLFAVLCYTCFRFIEEFFRDSTGLTYVGEIHFGLKAVHWILLIAILFLTTFLIHRERNGKAAPEKRVPLLLHPIADVLLLGTVFIFIILNYNWFSYFELATLIFFLLPALLGYLLRTYKIHTVKQLRWVLPLICLSGIIVMGQTYIPIEGKASVTYLEIAVNGFASRYHEQISQHTGTGTDCNGNSYAIMENTAMMSYSTYMGSFEAAKTIMRSKYTVYKVGGGLFFGNDIVTRENPYSKTNESSYGGHIRGTFDWKFFGFGIGFRVGQQRVASLNKDRDNIDIGDYENQMGEYIFLPIQCIRVGKLDILYVNGNMAFDLPAGKPLPFFSGGLGSGLGKTDGTLLEAGYSDAGLYLKGAYVIKNQHVIEAFYSDMFKSGYDEKRVFSLGYRYRFNFNTIRLAP